MPLPSFFLLRVLFPLSSFAVSVEGVSRTDTYMFLVLQWYKSIANERSVQNGMPAVSGGALVQLPRAELPLSVRGCVCSLNGAKGWRDSRLVKPSRTPFGYRDFIICV